jgi:hypothetical protein
MPIGWKATVIGARGSGLGARLTREFVALRYWALLAK